MTKRSSIDRQAKSRFKSLFDSLSRTSDAANMTAHVRDMIARVRDMIAHV